MTTEINKKWMDKITKASVKMSIDLLGLKVNGPIPTSISAVHLLEARSRIAAALIVGDAIESGAAMKKIAKAMEGISATMYKDRKTL